MWEWEERVSGGRREEAAAWARDEQRLCMLPKEGGTHVWRASQPDARHELDGVLGLLARAQPRMLLEKGGPHEPLLGGHRGVLAAVAAAHKLRSTRGGQGGMR